MKMKNIKVNYHKLRKQTVSMQTANVLLVGILGISLFYNTQKDTIVINNASATCEVVEMGRDRMGESSHINLGYYMAEMLGNITPKNSKFIEDAVMPFVDANIYREVETILALELKHIVDDHVTYDFQAENAFFEDGKTFVTGKSITTGATGNRESSIRTFEFEFHVNNYTTTMKYLDVYNELPHDTKWRKKQANSEG